MFLKPPSTAPSTKRPTVTRNVLLLMTSSGRVIHNAAPAYGARLMHAAGEERGAICGVRGEPIRATNFPRCKRCFKEDSDG